jgi:hypothetical protein
MTSANSMLQDEVLDVFRRHIGLGRRGDQPVPLDTLAIRIQGATNAQLSEFVCLHSRTLGLGYEVTPHATGHKGLVFDYFADRQRSKGSRFCALWIVTDRQHAGAILVYIHRLSLSECQTDAAGRHFHWGEERSSGTPRTWIEPSKRSTHRIFQLITESFCYYSACR